MTINKDNIHLHYKFMGDEDLKKYSNIINVALLRRLSFIFEELSISSDDYLFIEKNFLKEIFINKICVAQYIFNIKDTLQPIDEYIEEIKSSKQFLKILQGNRKEYMMLGRLLQDTIYFLGNGNGCEKHLWAKSIDGQFNEMRRLHNLIVIKPKWLNLNEINELEKEVKEL